MAHQRGAHFALLSRDSSRPARHAEWRISFVATDETNLEKVEIKLGNKYARLADFKPKPIVLAGALTAPPPARRPYPDRSPPPFSLLQRQ